MKQIETLALPFTGTKHSFVVFSWHDSYLWTSLGSPRTRPRSGCPPGSGSHCRYWRRGGGHSGSSHSGCSWPRLPGSWSPRRNAAAASPRGPRGQSPACPGCSCRWCGTSWWSQLTASHSYSTGTIFCWTGFHWVFILKSLSNSHVHPLVAGQWLRGCCCAREHFPIHLVAGPGKLVVYRSLSAVWWRDG